MKHVDLFSGIGGFTLGFQEAGIETVAFCEKDDYCQQVLAKHWPEVPICPDIHDFPDWWEDHRVEGETYVVSAGFPCQPFSFTGKKEGVEDERWLWPETARAIRAVRPKYLLLENVAALTTYSDAFGQILSDISTWGSMRNGVLYQHQNSEHSTSDEGLSFFPTPTANMGQKGINWAISLSEVVISRLPDFLARLDLKDGLPKLSNGKVNPLIVEWLMGFPLDYSKVGSEHWETLYIPRLQHITPK